jgi:TM2 domain-containing membrane protein YozV
VPGSLKNTNQKQKYIYRRKPKIPNRVGKLNNNLILMEQSKIDLYLAQNAKMLPANKLPLIKDALTKFDDNKLIYLQSVEYKEPSTVLIVSILLGTLGIDRFMLGEAGMGVLKLLTCGGAYIWWIIDMINAQDATKAYNYKKLCETLMQQGITLF